MISGFTIVRNAQTYNYPVIESIKSILPICDEFIVNVGNSKDETLKVIESLKSSKIRIIQTQWNMAQGPTVLSEQTNIALKECKGDWAFYLQTDEVIHELDLPRLKKTLDRYQNDPDVDALRLKWLHFYGSYCRYRIDAGWYQKQDRIIRNNGTIESFGDAFAFRRVDGKRLHSKQTGAFLYHYGWVQPNDVMAKRRINAQQIGFIDKAESTLDGRYDYGDLNRFPVYFGSHPSTMHELVNSHELTKNDWKDIKREKWWNPLVYLRPRFKTFRRVKEKIE